MNVILYALKYTLLVVEGERGDISGICCRACRHTGWKLVNKIRTTNFIGKNGISKFPKNWPFFEITKLCNSNTVEFNQNWPKFCWFYGDFCLSQKNVWTESCCDVSHEKLILWAYFWSHSSIRLLLFGFGTAPPRSPKSNSLFDRPNKL